jgi:hypothetical protein
MSAHTDVVVLLLTCVGSGIIIGMLAGAAIVHMRDRQEGVRRRLDC